MKPRDSLARALAELRDIRPSPELHDRLDQALREAEHAERTRATQRRGARQRFGRNFVLVVPALASMAVALHLVVTEPGFDAARTAEHALALPTHGGEGALDLDLWLDGHATEFAAVRMHVPHGVSVASSGGGAVMAAPSCHDTGCIYEFMHSTRDDAPVQVRVKQPGRYRVQVEHASDGHRVQETLLLHAHR